MIDDVKQELLKVYSDNLQAPYFGSMKQWLEKNVELPPAYAINGKLDLGISPYLLKPLQAIENPKIYQVNLAMATQVGKSLLSELAILYWIINAPAPIYRIFQNNDISAVFAETRLIPLLKNCPPIKPLLDYDRFSTRKTGVILPHMAITLGGANEGRAHGMSIRYLLCDELHQWEVGMFNKFLARTTAFAGRRKIICASQPSRAGSEWEQIYSKGNIYEWQWLCPKCNTRQPYHWSKEKKNGGYAGFNWDSILNSKEETDIAESAKTTWLECENCDHRYHDTPSERNELNKNGDYVLIKSGGDEGVVSYTCPNFVNPNLSFAYATSQYMLAKRMKRMTGLDEQLEIFVEQILGKFYHRELEADLSKILVETYEKDNLDNDWMPIMSVDVQRTGNIKYWVVRAWHKNGNESKRLDFGICRDWSEVDAIAKKYKVPIPLVGIDSGDGERTLEIYQECIKHGQVLTIGGKLQYISWSPLKGDQKVNYKHADGVTRLYSPVSNQDSQFPTGHKLKGIPAPLILWSNYSVKTILANLRDNKIAGVSWKVDRKDDEYDKQMYSEDLVDVVDKKSGVTTKRWIQTRTDNHWLDVESMNLLMAIRANVFSATKINEEEMKKLIDNSKKVENKL